MSCGEVITLSAPKGPRGSSLKVKTAHYVHNGYYVQMETLSDEVPVADLRSNLSDILGRAMYGGERIGITRNGKLTAVVVSVSDLEALESFEMAQDHTDYRAALKEDDGGRVRLDELIAEIAELEA